MEGSPGIVFGHVILEAGEKRSCGDQRPVEAVKQPWKLRRGPFHVLLELNSTRDMHELVTANAERCCGVDIRRTNSKKKKEKRRGLSMAARALFALCRRYRSCLWGLGVGVCLHGGVMVEKHAGEALPRTRR